MTESPRSNPYAPGWSCPICGATNYYNCPNITPIAFLQAVMHDPTVSIRNRTKAAMHLSRLKDKGIHSDEQPEPAYKVIIPPLMVN